MIVATTTRKLDYIKAQQINALLKNFANNLITQPQLEEKLKKLGCKEVLKFYKLNN